MKEFIDFYNEQVARSDHPHTTERGVILFGINNLSSRIVRDLEDSGRDAHPADTDLLQARMYANRDAYRAAAQALNAGYNKLI